jgi:hypothetical protein
LSSGPITLFDKSTVQSLNPDESVWFDNFYRTVISPLFFVETLKDLSKEVEAGRAPEQVVGNFAAKTPETGSVVSVDHWHLRLADLDGYQIEIERPPYIAQGRRLQVDGPGRHAF